MEIRTYFELKIIEISHSKRSNEKAEKWLSFLKKNMAELSSPGTFEDLVLFMV